MTGEASPPYAWPADVPLVIPREGEYADFFGREPRLVKRVTYTYEIAREVTPELVKLTIHIQTA